MTPDRWTRRVTLVLAALSLLLSGCTTYVATHVTAFSDWSGDDASRTYAFTRTPRQENSIEQSTYEGLVANELASHAFRRVDEAQAQYLVGLSYSSRREIVNVAQPAYFYNPWPGPYWRGQIDRGGRSGRTRADMWTAAMPNTRICWACGLPRARPAGRSIR